MSRLFAVVAAAVLAVVLMPPPASAAAKSVYIPASWKSTGEVPWSQDRTRESANFILLWGEKSGTNPVSAPSPYTFDPDNILSQLESLYSYYVNTMKFTPETGALATYKIDVIVTQTWNRAELNAWATGGSADGKVGVINIAPAAALPGSWGLAHELGHVFQNLTFLGRSGYGFTDASAGTFWEASAEYMAMQVYPDGGAGDLTRFLRTENLAYSSSRHHYGAWMLIQYLVDRNGGVSIFNRLWNEARSGEHPLETYRRLMGFSQQQLNADLAGYAQRQVTYDYTNKSHFQRFVDGVYGAGFINAYNGVPVEAVGNHYAIPAALAPSDYGYNKIKLVPSGSAVQLRFKGHVNAAAGSGWSYGFVAVKNGVPRYGPVSTAADGQISFALQDGERELYLVVLGAPSTVHHYGFLDGYTKNYRYPYEFALSGAVPSGFEPGYTKPAATGGGHWHSNGGGWVDNRATVAPTAYVGPRAAVYGSSTVSGNARIEGLAWVNSGARVGGNAVVKDNALIQGGADLSGSVVVGGDAELASACGSGTYLLFDPNRGCDGRAGETDVNPSYTPFTDAEMALTGTTPPPTTPAPTTPAPAGSCSARLAVTGSWTGGFQGEVTVTAGAAGTTAWTVGWPLTAGQRILQSWGATVTASGTTVTATNAAWNGTLAPAAGTTFGFIGEGTPSTPALSCSAS
ncbi:DUF6055 domain-containing protein [Actinoplanes sp. NPDC000266]